MAGFKAPSPIVKLVREVEAERLPIMWPPTSTKRPSFEQDAERVSHHPAEFSLEHPLFAPIRNGPDPIL